MKKVLRIVIIVIGSLVGLILVAGLVLFYIGNARLTKTYDTPASNLPLPTDAEGVEYGKHRAETLCQGCHGADLSGIDNWFNAPPIGSIDSANLTSGSGGMLIVTVYRSKSLRSPGGSASIPRPKYKLTHESQISG